ncbi:unnamed protein product [Rotaria sp. Silwood1]|nr:unnamed protein product [Rotaria sp. Silwood1]CAF5011767.1 unnamed protein product [Rotaria sp. Silwood1]
MTFIKGNVYASALRWDGLPIETVINAKAQSNHQPITICYYFDKNLNKKYQKSVLDAIHDIEEAAPGIQFSYSETASNRIRIFYGSNSRSSIGMTRGQQDLELGWNTKGNVLHELLHALGFAHEHQREDRDQYVQCLSEDSNNYDIMGMPIGRYDADSIMHYSTEKGTILNRILWASHNDKRLSNGDKIVLNTLYPPAIRNGTWNPKQGTTGLFYCGKHNMEDNNAPFGRIGVDGYCGPDNGPNCPICRTYGGIQSRYNDEGRKATQGETGLFYCGTKFVPKQAKERKYHDGFCGPNNGPNCESCSKLLD